MSTEHRSFHRLYETVAADSEYQRSRTRHNCAAALDDKSQGIVALTAALVAGHEACVSFHAHKAIQAGASAQEINELLNILMLMDAGVQGACLAVVKAAISEAYELS